MRFSCIILLLIVQLVWGFEFTKYEVIEQRETVREMFYHAYNNYLEHAYPDDELKPLSCTGRRRDELDSRGDMDDVLGNYSLTLLDTLDTLIVLGDYEEFERVSYLYFNTVSFDTDITINLFEVNIRALGGLISAHLLAKQLQQESELLISNEKQDLNEFDVEESNEQILKYGILGEYQINLINELQQFFEDQTYNYLFTKDHQRLFNQLDRTKSTGYFINYDNEYLSLALDLGLRLLPAFQTATGIPYSKVNLKNGVMENEVTETCLAGAGTLILEFGALSRLTGYSIFETSAKTAMRRLVSKRSNQDLLASMIDIQTGKWINSQSTIGAGSDSFYEYLFKAYVLFGNGEYLDQFSLIYNAILKHHKRDHFYYGVDYKSGFINKQHVDSLSAFWPGLQVLVGDLPNAIESHLRFFSLASIFGFLPEAFYPVQQQYNRMNDDYPLRPEYIESTYYLYKATQHPFYRASSKFYLSLVNNLTRVDCGFASIGIYDLSLDDRMDSFFLSETLKYMYLIFDDSHWIDNGNYLFTTEAHIFDINLLHRTERPPFNEGYCSAVDEEIIERLNKLLDDPKALIETSTPPDSNFKPSTLIETVVTIISEHVVIRTQLGEDQRVIEASAAQFGPEFPYSPEFLRSEIVIADPLDACQPLTGDYTGKIVLTQRGTCLFSDKVENVQNVNGIAAIIFDNSSAMNHLYVSMSGDEGGEDRIQIPSCFISLTDGEDLIASLESGSEIAMEISHSNIPLIYLDKSDLQSVSSEYYMKILKEMEEALKNVKFTSHINQLAVQLQIMEEDVPSS